MIERVDPTTVAEDAAGILRDAWPLPAINYTTEIMRWHLGFPGAADRLGSASAGAADRLGSASAGAADRLGSASAGARAFAVLAREDGAPAGFFGATPRRFRFRGEVDAGYILSFLGVRPAFQGRGLGGKLYEEIFLMFREAGAPVLVFVEAHSPAAQRVLLKTVERLDFKMKRLGQHVNHGFMARRGAASGTAAVAREADPEELLAVVDACGGERVLWAAPDRHQMDHYLRDPRGRKLFVVEEGGRAIGAGMAFLAEIVTPQGMDRVATLDALFLPAPLTASAAPRLALAEPLAALARAVSAAFAAQATTPAISVPSLATVDPDVIKAAGLRRTGATYDAFMVHAGGHRLLEAEVTSSEVV